MNGFERTESIVYCSIDFMHIIADFGNYVWEMVDKWMILFLN